MKKNFIRRTLSILLVLVTLAATVAPAVICTSAAVEKSSASASISSVAVNTSKNFYTVKKETALRSSTSIFYSKLATLPKDSLVKTSGESGNYWKVKLSVEGKNKTYYVKKADLKTAPKSTNATFCYTVNNAAIRLAPCAEGTKLMNASKGSVLKIISKLTNDHGHLWYVIMTDTGEIAYVYSNNVKTFSKLTLKVSCDSFISTAAPAKITYSVTPAAVKGITFSTSNSRIAKVDSNGTVTGVAGGDAIITANLAGLVSASLPVNVSLGVKVYRQSKNYTCSAASVLAVLNYRGKCLNTNDATLYSAKITDGYVYKIVNVLNAELNNTYCWEIIRNYDVYEQRIRTSLAQNSPAIARVGFGAEYFNYKTSCHYTTIVGLYTKDGATWAICVDSFVDRYDSNTYTDAATGIVHVPLLKLYEYNTCSGGDRYLIYNP